MKQVKVKPVKAWAIVDNTGEIWRTETHRTKWEAIASVTYDSVDNETWKQFYRAGWRVIRVEIKPIDSSKPRR